MNSGTVDGDEELSSPVEITLRLGETGDIWVARDEETGVASQGETRETALENLDEAVALYQGAVGREPTNEELRAIGVDPENNTSGELPDVFE